MFEHYIFGASTPANTIIEDTFPSPKDCTSLPLTTFSSSPTCLEVDDGQEEEEEGGLNNIISQLSTSLLQSSSTSPLQPDETPQSSIWAPTAPDFTSEELTYTSLRRGKVYLHDRKRARESSEEHDRRGLCKRKARMRDVRLLSCVKHQKDIEGLVSSISMDSTDTSSRCDILSSGSATSSQPSTSSSTQTNEVPAMFESVPLELDLDTESSSPLEADDFPSLEYEMHIHDDEGFVDSPSSPSSPDLDLGLEFSIRRARTPKWNVLRYRANGQLAGLYVDGGYGGAYGVNGMGVYNTAMSGEVMGRKKVRCVPRMRRRRKIEDRAAAGLLSSS